MSSSFSDPTRTKVIRHFALPLITGVSILVIASCATMSSQSERVVSTDNSPKNVEIPVEESLQDEAEAQKITITASRLKAREAKRSKMQKAMSLMGNLVRPSPDYYQDTQKETYQSIEQSQIQLVSEKPVSTFSIDVDTGGYTNVRRMLRNGLRPQKDQVRVEEIINYFSYAYPHPESKSKPFEITTTLMHSPWNSNKHLLHVGIQGFEEDPKALPAANLVFLVDVSGSMRSHDKLPLVKQSLKLLVDNLRDEDKVSLVTYADGTKVVLPSTSGKEKRKIRQAIDKLVAGGSTAGESGLKLAYDEAESGMIEGGNNRIIMMTDGDFNVGLSSVEAMIKMVEEKRKSGVFLSTAGFGQGNYREDMMEQIADHGNGSYFYIDSYEEAHRAFERNLRSSLFAIAKDVKIQVEFNPQAVSEYRLVGYENRKLNREDFNNDKVDAGEVGQGHSVTAIYELTLSGNKGSVDPLRYGKNKASDKETSNELAFVKLRYKPLESDKSQLISKAVLNQMIGADDIGYSQKMAVAAASFGELLRQSRYLSNDYGYTQLLSAVDKISHDFPGEVSELESLVQLAKTLNRTAN